MLKLVLLALLFFRPDAATVQHNDRAIAAARAAVRDMASIAVTPEEKTLAEKDRLYVERAAELLAKRAEEEAHAEAAGKQLQETQMSFNMQYLQLQQKMQDESRSYTAISNIMKTKHDTVKNSINNVR